jgi:hypothetical protein
MGTAFFARRRDMGANHSVIDIVMPALGSISRNFPAQHRATANLAKPPQDAVDEVAIVLGRASAASLSRLPFNRQQHLQSTALDLRQIAGSAASFG